MKLIFEKNYIGLHTKKKKNTFNHFHRQTDQRRFYHSRGGNGSAPAGGGAADRCYLGAAKHNKRASNNHTK